MISQNTPFLIPYTQNGALSFKTFFLFPVDRLGVFPRNLSGVLVKFWHYVPGQLVPQFSTFLVTTEAGVLYTVLADVWRTVPRKYGR